MPEPRKVKTRLRKSSLWEMSGDQLTGKQLREKYKDITGKKLPVVFGKGSKKKIAMATDLAARGYSQEQISRAIEREFSGQWKGKLADAGERIGEYLEERKGRRRERRRQMMEQEEETKPGKAGAPIYAGADHTNAIIKLMLILIILGVIFTAISSVFR